MRTSRAPLAALAAVVLVLALVLAAGSAARDSGPAAATQAGPPAPAASQPAPPALATSPSATQRSFVSGLGSDANLCTRTAPCRNFAKAISETLPNGEVIVLDSAGYGPFTIDKSIDIIAPAGVYAGVTAFTGDAITINTAATDRVVLRGLTLNGLGANNGVNVLQVGTLYLQQLVLKKFGNAGLFVAVPAASTPRVFVEDTVAHDNFVGLRFFSGATQATIEHSRAGRNNYGLLVEFGAKASARDSLAAGNVNEGFWAFGSGAELNLERGLATQNGTGVRSTSAIVRISETMVTNNTTGLSADAGSPILSWGTNRVHGNGTNGAPTGPIAQV